jgi:hypothetical protein
VRAHEFSRFALVARRNDRRVGQRPDLPERGGQIAASLRDATTAKSKKALRLGAAGRRAKPCGNIEVVWSKTSKIRAAKSLRFS